MYPRDFRSVTRRLQQALGEPSVDAPVEDASRKHIRSVHDQIAAISRGDLERMLSEARDDVQLDIFAPPEFPWIRRAQGIAELRRALEQNFGSVEDQQPEIINVVAQDNVVVLIGRERGRIRATGTPYDVEFVERFTFLEGRLQSVRIIAAKSVA